MFFPPYYIGERWWGDFAVLEKVKKVNKANPGLKKMSSEDGQRYL